VEAVLNGDQPVQVRAVGHVEVVVQPPVAQQPGGGEVGGGGPRTGRSYESAHAWPPEQEERDGEAERERLDCGDAPHQEFLKFLKKVAKAYPDIDLHVVCDNYSAHKHADVNKWLENNPRVQLHFTPTHSSWMNLVEVFFAIITRQAIRRGSFRSVRELTDAIQRFIDAWNERCQPFVWTKTADEILAKANRKGEPVTDH
jgi:transposase